MSGWFLLVIGALLLARSPVRYRLRPARVRLQWPGRRRRARTPESIAELIAGFRDELVAGAALRPAFERAAVSAGSHVCPQAVAVSQMGGQVPAALREDARGDPLLLSLAALWQVCEGSGGALAAALDRLVDGARQTAAVRREISSQLAGPRATMRVLAVLPGFGMLLGLGIGVNPLGFLLGSFVGWCCLTVAMLLEVAGVVWMRRLVGSIEDRL